MSSLFSIIIPCYNSGKTIRRTLESIVNQNMKDDIEVIIADDCSDISYINIIDSYKDRLNINYIEADHHYGYPGHTREVGVSVASGKYITFIDHDDEFIENILCKIKDIIEKKIPLLYILTLKSIKTVPNIDL